MSTTNSALMVREPSFSSGSKRPRGSPFRSGFQSTSVMILTGDCRSSPRMGRVVIFNALPRLPGAAKLTALMISARSIPPRSLATPALKKSAGSNSPRAILTGSPPTAPNSREREVTSKLGVTRPPALSAPKPASWAAPRITAKILPGLPVPKPSSMYGPRCMRAKSARSAPVASSTALSRARNSVSAGKKAGCSAAASWARAMPCSLGLAPNTREAMSTVVSPGLSGSARATFCPFRTRWRNTPARSWLL